MSLGINSCEFVHSNTEKLGTFRVVCSSKGYVVCRF